MLFHLSTLTSAGGWSSTVAVAVTTGVSARSCEGTGQHGGHWAQAVCVLAYATRSRIATTTTTTTQAVRKPPSNITQPATLTKTETEQHTSPQEHWMRFDT